MQGPVSSEIFSFSQFAISDASKISRCSVSRSWGTCISAAAGSLFRRATSSRRIAALAALFAAASAIFSSCAPAYAGHAHRESWYADALAAETSARTEVRMGDGTRCDVLTASHAVEVEFAAKWCEAVGQSLNYASQTGKAGAIALILESPSDARFLQRLRSLIAFHRLPLAIVVIRPVSDRGIAFENLSGLAPAWSLGAPLATPDLSKAESGNRKPEIK